MRDGVRLIEADAVGKAAAVVDQILALEPTEKRRIVAIAGPPASGKSTLANLVQSGLISSGVPTGLLAMDGFHMENPELNALGLLSRKGAPETFDLAGFKEKVVALKEGGTVKVPLFDRANDCTLPDASDIDAAELHVVVEGNYLLFDEPGWKDLAQFWDFSVFIEEPFEELKRRLLQRWIDHGLSPEQALARASDNDLANAARVVERRLPSSITLKS